MSDVRGGLGESEAAQRPVQVIAAQQHLGAITVGDYEVKVEAEAHTVLVAVGQRLAKERVSRRGAAFPRPTPDRTRKGWSRNGLNPSDETNS